MNGKHKFFAGEFSRSSLGSREILNLYAATVTRMPENPGILTLFRDIFENTYLSNCDLGYDGSPFVWNEEERRHLRARLDALYFYLYGLTREDAEYVLDTFPIVRREDEAAFSHYRTRDLILAYMNALSAGDTETVVAV